MNNHKEAGILLTVAGYVTRCAADGRQAVSALMEDSFDLALCDDGWTMEQGKMTGTK